jgi:hypothetical protein
MNRELVEAADEVRKIARDEARRASPPVERFRVRRVKPLRLESFRSDALLDEEDDDVIVQRGIRAQLKAGDTALVATERDGDRVVIGVAGKGDDADVSVQEQLDDLEKRVKALEE